MDFSCLFPNAYKVTCKVKIKYQEFISLAVLIASACFSVEMVYTMSEGLYK